MLLSSNGCSKFDYVLSSNLPAFIMQLVAEDGMWYELPIEVQRADVNALAQAKLSEINSGIVPIMDGQSSNSPAEETDNLGKLPLAVQQLSLAAERANKSGNIKLYQMLTDKINNLLGQIE